MKEKYESLIAHSSIKAYEFDGDDADRYYIPWRAAAEAAAKLSKGEKVLTILPAKPEFNEYLTLLSRILLDGRQLPVLFTPDEDYLMDYDIAKYLFGDLGKLVGSDTSIHPYQATPEFYDWAGLLERKKGVKIYADKKDEANRFWWGHKGAYHRWMDAPNIPSPFENLGLPIPRGFIAQDHEELNRARDLLGGRIVVKPIFGAGGFQIEKFALDDDLTCYEWPIDPNTQRNMPVAVQEHLPIVHDRFGERVFSHQFSGPYLQGRLTRQIMDEQTGQQWIGNRIPAGVSRSFEGKANRLCAQLIQYIQPKGDGGIDLADVNGEPYLIEVNGGRPTGATGPKRFQDAFAPDAPHFIFTKVPVNGFTAHEAWEKIANAVKPRTNETVVFSRETGRGVFPLVWLPQTWGMLASFGSTYAQAEASLMQARNKLGV